MNEARTASKSASTLEAPPTRASSPALDHLRARALRGDALHELTDSRREWVWRSLLKGLRTQEALALAGMTTDDLAPALERIRQRYQRRLDQYKQAAEQQLRVRKPVTKAPATSAAHPTRKRAGWWPFVARR